MSAPQQDQAAQPGRTRYDLCWEALNRQPRLITDADDLKTFDRDTLRYLSSLGLAATSMPVQLFYMVKLFRSPELRKNPVIVRKYFFRSATWLTFSIGFLAYAHWKHSQVEELLYDKYLGRVSMWGLERLADGHPLDPSMITQVVGPVQMRSIVYNSEQAAQAFDTK